MPLSIAIASLALVGATGCATGSSAEARQVEGAQRIHASMDLIPPPPSGQAGIPSVPPVPASQPADLVRVVLTTAEGPITLALDRGRAPLTTANFLRYLDAKRLDGITFYRAMRIGPEGGLIQGGVRDPAKLFPPVAHEPTSRTGLRHEDGTVSLARGAPGSARADFFITVGAVPSLDAGTGQAGDDLGFAAFGRVVEGMDTVRRILGAPTSPTAGEGVMRGQMLAAPVRVVTARRVR